MAWIGFEPGLEIRPGVELGVVLQASEPVCCGLQDRSDRRRGHGRSPEASRPNAGQPLLNDVADTLAAGWFLTTPEAKAAHEAPAEPKEDSKPTREELEQKATELGLKFDGRTSDRKLSDLIDAKLGA